MKRLFSHWRATVCHFFQSLSAEVARFCFAFEVTLYHLVLVCVSVSVCVCVCVYEVRLKLQECGNPCGCCNLVSSHTSGET